MTTYTYDSQSRFERAWTTQPALPRPTSLPLRVSVRIGFSRLIDLQIHRTNSYFYSNDLVVIQTNELGLVTTNTWDNLQRLTSSTYPDGSYVSNIYLNLDRIETIDRLGNPTKYDYDDLRHLVAVTNALTNVTLYSYCTCGALESMQDALGYVTSYSYDIAGRLVNTAYPDTTSISNNYSSLDQITKYD